MTEGATREIATLSDVEGLRKVLRSRAEEIGLSRRTLDELAGLTAGHAEKLLSEAATKQFGPTSFFPMIGALGLELRLVETPQAMRRVNRASRRVEHKVRKGLEHWRRAKALATALEVIRANGVEGGKARFAKMTPEQRREHQAKAGRARWGKTKPRKR